MRDLDVIPRYCLENGLPFHTFIEMCKNVFFYLISSLMQMRASQKRSSSALESCRAQRSDHGLQWPPDLERILRLSQLRLELGHLSVIERELLESPSTSLSRGDR